MTLSLISKQPNIHVVQGNLNQHQQSLQQLNEVPSRSRSEIETTPSTTAVQERTAVDLQNGRIQREWRKNIATQR